MRGVVKLVLLAVAFLVPLAYAQVPQAAQQHRALLVRTAHAAWGLDAPVAVFAAQVHQESAWRPDAVSHVGAQGLAQFMPATTRWIASQNTDLATQQPYNPAWALRALVTYDRWLYDRTPAHYLPRDRMWVTDQHRARQMLNQITPIGRIGGLLLERSGDLDLQDRDLFNARHSLLLDALEHRRCRESEQVEFAHRHVVDLPVARQDDIAEDGRQFTAHLTVFAEHTERTGAGLPREACRHRCGFFVLDHLAVGNLPEVRRRPIEGCSQGVQEHGRDLVRVLAAAAVGMREITARELLDDDLVGSHLRKQRRNAPAQHILNVGINARHHALRAEVVTRVVLALPLPMHHLHALGIVEALIARGTGLVHAGEVQGIKVKWREVGWNALIKEFAPDSIGAELLEVEA